MTRAEVIAMARGVGIWCTLTDVACAIDALERFAALVAEAEREACADLVDERLRAIGGFGMDEIASDLVMELRMRSNV